MKRVQAYKENKKQKSKWEDSKTTIGKRVWKRDGNIDVDTGE